ncbi:MAG: hypothetical protein PHE56_13000 [Bacteroidales bacterium]|nr:hypothetical protein [Bacteroidales bacterium]
MLSSEEIKKRLDITNETIKNLELYKNRTIAQIPDNIKQNLRKLTVSQYMTASGFEKVTSILTRLYVSRYYLEKAYEDPEAFKEQYSRPVVKPPSTTTPKTPDRSIKIDISSDDKPTPPNTNEAITKPTPDQKPTIKINLNSTPTSNQERISTSTSSTPSTPSVPPKNPPPSSNISL